MFRQVVVVFLLLSGQSQAMPLPQDDIADSLAHAEALYYEARFNESIQLLARIDDVLRPQTGRLKDKVTVKLQLALAHIGLDENAEARALLRELYALDEAYRLDSLAFSPKVLALASEAKAEADENRCRKVRTDAQTLLVAGNAKELLKLISSKRSSCSDLAEFEPGTADLLYKSGLDLYKRGELLDAQEEFHGALKLSPNHELAAQYMELTLSKLQISTDRLFIEWQKRFAANDFNGASTRYRQLASLEGDAVKEMVGQMNGEYHDAVSALGEAWDQACAAGDAAKVEMIRRQAAEMLPDTAIAQDLLDEMTLCVSTSCLQMNSQLAMARLKTRVNPIFPPAVREMTAKAPATVRIRVKIDEKGDVSVGDILGGSPVMNEPLRRAVERWKFIPATDRHGPRCVDTEFPMVIRP